MPTWYTAKNRSTGNGGRWSSQRRPHKSLSHRCRRHKSMGWLDITVPVGVAQTTPRCQRPSTGKKNFSQSELKQFKARQCGEMVGGVDLCRTIHKRLQSTSLQLRWRHWRTCCGRNLLGESSKLAVWKKKQKVPKVTSQQHYGKVKMAVVPHQETVLKLLIVDQKNSTMTRLLRVAMAALCHVVFANRQPQEVAMFNLQKSRLIWSHSTSLANLKPSLLSATIWWRKFQCHVMVPQLTCPRARQLEVSAHVEQVENGTNWILTTSFLFDFLPYTPQVYLVLFSHNA